jgi:23S rRNA-/tRNA-specific pseudouridylate synthase
MRRIIFVYVGRRLSWHLSHSTSRSHSAFLLQAALTFNMASATRPQTTDARSCTITSTSVGVCVDTGTSIAHSVPAMDALDDKNHDIIDNPCWGSPSEHSLAHLLSTITKPTTVLYESSDYIIVNKPPDLRMDGDYPATLHKLLWYWYRPASLKDNADYFREYPKLNSIPDTTIRPCHQLDYATSGVLLVARSQRAAKLACDAFQQRRISKAYVAIVRGMLSTKGDTVDMDSAQLQQQLLLMEATREATRGKRRQDTFAGFQPPHTIFLKWKGLVNHTGRKRLREEPIDICEHVNRHLSKLDQEWICQAGWGAIKKHRHVFQSMSASYNAALKEKQQQQQQQTDVPPNTIGSMQSLPTFFRLSDQLPDDPTFYIYASLAQQPDSFAMKMCSSSNITTTTTPLQPDSLDYKPSLTKCQILHHNKDSGTTKVLLTPHTGRRHQLRCHMLLCGTPIVGDATYGLRDDSAYRMCLHAHSLELMGVFPKVVAPDPWEVKEPALLLVDKDDAEVVA